MKQHIPNLLTLTNLFLGCIGIVSLFTYNLQIIPWIIMLCFACDVADGAIARRLGIKSELGGELDSLADVVSFGVLPGMMMFNLINRAMRLEAAESFDMANPSSIQLLPFVAFAIPVFSAYRLAKFNIDTRQTDSFMGLPTPSSAGFVTGLFWMTNNNIFGLAEKSFPLILAFICGVLAYLLVSDLPMFSLKFKGKQWKGNEEKYISLILAVALLAAFQFGAFAIGTVLYVAYSVVKMVVFPAAPQPK